MSVPIAVFASGRGSNFEAIRQSIEKGELDARIVAVVSDRPDARVVARARDAGLKTVCIPLPAARPGESVSDRRKQHEAALLSELELLQPHFLVLAGYMRVLASTLIDAFRCEQGYSRIVNIHPSLLPAFPGMGGYQQAYRFGAQVSGVTIHLVEQGVDDGPICAQEAFPIGDCKSPEAVERRGLSIENRLYPQTLKWVLKEEFSLEVQTQASPDERERARVRPN